MKPSDLHRVTPIVRDEEEDTRGLLVSDGFWGGLVLCIAVWSVLYLIFSGAFA